MAHANLQKQKDSFSASTVKLKNKQERAVGYKYEVTVVKGGRKTGEGYRPQKRIGGEKSSLEKNTWLEEKDGIRGEVTGTP